MRERDRERERAYVCSAHFPSWKALVTGAIVGEAVSERAVVNGLEASKDRAAVRSTGMPCMTDWQEIDKRTLR
jgi:hypothetical protein